MTKSSVTTILFDLDGTLIDSVDLILASYRHTLEAHGIGPVSEESLLRSMVIPLRVQFRKFTEDPNEVQAMIDTYVRHNLDHHDALVAQYPGVRDEVWSLHQNGYRLGVVTSKMHGSLERGLAAGGYDGLFEVLVGADDVENPKPHPEPVQLALGRLGVEPESAIYVGDSIHDMAVGRAAGVRIAAAMWGPFKREELEKHEPDYWLEEPPDIQRLAQL